MDRILSWGEIGDIGTLIGKLDIAHEGALGALDAAERAQDAPNAAVALSRIGDVLVAQGNLSAALKSFQAGLDIIDRLAKDDPGNASWLADLAASHGKMGLVLKAAGRNDEARAHFLKGRGIVAPLVEQAPDVVLWGEYLTSFDGLIAELGG